MFTVSQHRNGYHVDINNGFAHVICRDVGDVELCLRHWANEHISAPNPYCPFCEQIKTREARNERSQA